jgi:hypothetical protein
MPDKIIPPTDPIEAKKYVLGNIKNISRYKVWFSDNSVEKSSYLLIELKPDKLNVPLEIGETSDHLIL